MRQHPEGRLRERAGMSLECPDRCLEVERLRILANRVEEDS
jgi:hypothetical protein